MYSRFIYVIYTVDYQYEYIVVDQTDTTSYHVFNKILMHI